MGVPGRLGFDRHPVSPLTEVFRTTRSPCPLRVTPGRRRGAASPAMSRVPRGLPVLPRVRLALRLLQFVVRSRCAPSLSARVGSCLSAHRRWRRRSCQAAALVSPATARAGSSRKRDETGFRAADGCVRFSLADRDCEQVARVAASARGSPPCRHYCGSRSSRARTRRACW